MTFRLGTNPKTGLAYGRKLYTLAIHVPSAAQPAEGGWDELDVLGYANASPQQIVDWARYEIREMYGPSAVIVGIGDPDGDNVIFDVTPRPVDQWVPWGIPLRFNNRG